MKEIKSWRDTIPRLNVEQGEMVEEVKRGEWRKNLKGDGGRTRKGRGWNIKRKGVEEEVEIREWRKKLRGNRMETLRRGQWRKILKGSGGGN